MKPYLASLAAYHDRCLVHESHPTDTIYYWLLYILSIVLHNFLVFHPGSPLRVHILSRLLLRKDILSQQSDLIIIVVGILFPLSLYYWFNWLIYGFWLHHCYRLHYVNVFRNL